ncbi:FAD-dependent oxidoreductase [symbiont of Argiope bruennichi]|uniref:NAD(P)/FAD-dependent oxidoreductase n=1 Tax=symbiont of Argiope bruennichi TaxID=2810479 RepID=UPI003DA376DD
MIENNQKIFDLCVIGCGPAGITAAIFALRAELKVVVIEKDVPGGKIVKTGIIENYPGFKSIDGPTLALDFYNHLMNLQPLYLYGEVLKLKNISNYYKEITYFSNNQEKIVIAKSVIIAVGMTEKKIGVDKEEEFFGKGISYCAVCDGALYKGGTIAVIGGGNSALEESIYLTKFVKTLYLIHRRYEFRADKILQKKIRELPQIKLLLNYILLKINGTDRLSSIEIIENNTKKILKLDIDCLFTFIGLSPNINFLSDLNLKTDNNFIAVNESFETSVKGIYAIGDVINKKLRQITTAVSEGSIAAQEIISYLEEENANK